MRAPLRPIQIVDRRRQLRVFQAFPAQQRAHVRPVLLFDLGVVILVIRPGAGEGDRRFAPGEIVQPRIVEELRTVVAVKACAGEGGLPFQVGDLFLDARRAFVPDGPQLGPTAENVRQDEAPDKIPGQRAAAVRHRVGFDENPDG